MKIKSVFIADDHYTTLEKLGDILRTDFSCDRVVMFSHLDIARKEIGKYEYDLYILDLEFKNEKAFDLIRVARKHNPGARIIVHTMHEELWYVDELISYRVNGILFKSSPIKYINHAICEVLSGNTYVCPRTKELEKIYSQDRQRKRSKTFSLTPMEKRIAEELIHGYTTEDIAEKYSISIDTVETHRKNIYLKMNTTNSASLSAKLVHYGIVSYDEKKKKNRD